MSSKPRSVTGSCNCGKVTIRVARFSRDVVACHCTQCRKQTGHFVAAAAVANADLELHGEEHLGWYRASPAAQRGFCSHCGSVMLWRRDESDRTSVMAGCLDSPTGLKIIRHIFVENKGDYYDLDPEIQAFSQYD